MKSTTSIPNSTLYRLPCYFLSPLQIFKFLKNIFPDIYKRGIILSCYTVNMLFSPYILTTSSHKHTNTHCTFSMDAVQFIEQFYQNFLSQSPGNSHLSRLQFLTNWLEWQARDPFTRVTRIWVRRCPSHYHGGEYSLVMLTRN